MSAPRCADECGIYNNQVEREICWQLKEYVVVYEVYLQVIQFTIGFRG